MDDERAFDTWLELHTFLVAADWSGWIFRGQASFNWPLQTRLHRLLDPVSRGAWKDREDLAIGQFKARARLYLEDVPDEHDAIGWLSLMQHYGAPTRLLDWSESPFVATWFAYAEPDRDDDAALWALNAHACRSKFGRSTPSGRDHLGVSQSRVYQRDGLVEESFPGEDYDHGLEENGLLRHAIRESVVIPLPLMPLRPDRRMASQQSVFTLDASLDGLAFPLREPSPAFREDGSSEPVDVPLLGRVRLPNEWRKQALDALRLMNVSAETLFPGLDGLGRDVTLSLSCDLRLGARDLFDDRMSPNREHHSG